MITPTLSLYHFLSRLTSLANLVSGDSAAFALMNASSRSLDVGRRFVCPICKGASQMGVKGRQKKKGVSRATEGLGSVRQRC